MSRKASRFAGISRTRSALAGGVSPNAPKRSAKSPPNQLFAAGAAILANCLTVGALPFAASQRLCSQAT